MKKSLVKIIETFESIPFFRNLTWERKIFSRLYLATSSRYSFFNEEMKLKSAKMTELVSGTNNGTR